MSSFFIFFPYSVTFKICAASLLNTHVFEAGGFAQSLHRRGLSVALTKSPHSTRVCISMTLSEAGTWYPIL